MPRIDELFAEWEDYDFSAYYVACLLGIVKYDKSWDEYRRIKGLFWTNNPVGNILYDFLEKMVEAKLFEKDDDLGYRWNKSFNAYWLNPEISKQILE